MSLGNVRIIFSGLDDVDAGRLAAELEAAFETEVPGATATRIRTATDSTTYQDLGTSLLIAFVAESAVIASFKLLEKYMERKAKTARLTIDLGEVTPSLALVIAKYVERKHMSPGLAAVVDNHTKPSA